jgi:hypothetical protein
VAELGTGAPVPCRAFSKPAGAQRRGSRISCRGVTMRTPDGFSSASRSPFSISAFRLNGIVALFKQIPQKLLSCLNPWPPSHGQIYIMKRIILLVAVLIGPSVLASQPAVNAPPLAAPPLATSPLAAPPLAAQPLAAPPLMTPPLAVGPPTRAMVSPPIPMNPPVEIAPPVTPPVLEGPGPGYSYGYTPGYSGYESGPGCYGYGGWGD